MSESTFAPSAKREADFAYSTPLPKPRYGEVEMSLLGSDVRVGDSVRRAGLDLPVTATRLGYKYNSVTVPDLKKGERNINLTLSDHHTVVRRVETDESKTRREAVAFERALERAVSTYKPQLPSAIENLTTTLQSGKRLDRTHSYALSQAQGNDVVVNEYAKAVEAAEAEGTPMPYTVASGYLQAKYQEELVRTTSHFEDGGEGDLYERATLAAKASFLKSPARLFL